MRLSRAVMGVGGWVGGWVGSGWARTPPPPIPGGSCVIRLKTSIMSIILSILDRFFEHKHKHFRFFEKNIARRASTVYIISLSQVRSTVAISH